MGKNCQKEYRLVNWRATGSDPMMSKNGNVLVYSQQQAMQQAMLASNLIMSYFIYLSVHAHSRNSIFIRTFNSTRYDPAR